MYEFSFQFYVFCSTFLIVHSKFCTHTLDTGDFWSTKIVNILIDGGENGECLKQFFIEQQSEGL